MRSRSLDVVRTPSVRHVIVGICKPRDTDCVMSVIECKTKDTIHVRLSFLTINWCLSITERAYIFVTVC